MLKYRRWIYFWLIPGLISFAHSSTASASAKIKIIRIEGTNLFQTASGRMIAFANVRTLSLHDSNSFRCRIAYQIYRYERCHLLNHEFLVEPAAQRDSIQLVHLWKKYPLARISVNEQFLREGYGRFDPDRPNRYTAKYEKAAREAKKEGIGLYDKRQFLPKVPLKKNAFWISGGLGVGKQIFAKYGADGIFATDLSLQYRRELWAVSRGQIHLRLNEATDGKIDYLAVGRSFHDRLVESIVWVGISRNRLYHDAESACGIIKSNYFYSLHLKMQAVVHFPQVLGVGFSIVANIHRGHSYLLTYLNLHFGGWNF